MPDVPEFETFAIKKVPPGRSADSYEILLTMPKGSHVHFKNLKEITLRSAISKINNSPREPEGFHLAVHKVGDNDPRGPGFRVLRDDKPRRVSPNKRRVAP